jgi:hypothetical protein
MPCMADQTIEEVARRIASACTDLGKFPSEADINFTIKGLCGIYLAGYQQGQLEASQRLSEKRS